MQYGRKHQVDVRTKAAGAIIYNDKREILLVKELQGSKKGLWHIPSGTIEHGEFPIDAAKREIQEETGLVLNLSNYLNTYAGCFDDGELVLRHVWIEAFPTNQVLSTQFTDEIGAVSFFSKAEVLKLYREEKLRMHQTMLMVEDAHSYLTALVNA